MDPKFQTSFIPKQAYAGEGSSGTSLTLLISGAIFLVTLLAAGAVYFYAKQVDSQIAGSQDSIIKENQAFDLPFIESMVRLDTRIESGKKALNTHVAVSPLFSFLQKNMLKSIRFDSLTYSSSAQKISVVAHGQAQSYLAIAYQSELFSENRLIKDVIFSDFNLDASGAISFTFGATIDPNLISYKSAAAASSQ